MCLSLCASLLKSLCVVCLCVSLCVSACLFVETPDELLFGFMSVKDVVLTNGKNRVRDDTDACDG